MSIRLKGIVGWAIISAFALLITVGLVMSHGILKTIILFALVFLIIKGARMIVDAEAEEEEKRRRANKCKAPPPPLPPFRNPPPMPTKEQYINSPAYKKHMENEQQKKQQASGPVITFTNEELKEIVFNLSDRVEQLEKQVKELKGNGNGHSFTDKEPLY